MTKSGYLLGYVFITKMERKSQEYKGMPFQILRWFLLSLKASYKSKNSSKLLFVNPFQLRTDFHKQLDFHKFVIIHLFPSDYMIM